MATGDPADEDLMHAYVAGDVGAFETLYDRYERKLFGFFLRGLGDRGRAEDLLQRTFMNVHRARQRYRGGGFAAWIRSIAYNLYREELRRRGRKPEAELVVEPAAASPTAADRLDAAGELGRVREVLDTLSPPQREAVVLCRFLELDYTDAAALAGCSPEAMKLRAFRGLRALRSALDVAITSENKTASSNGGRSS